MAIEKLNISLQTEEIESIRKEARKRGMKINGYIRYLHEKDIAEQIGMNTIKELGIMEDLVKKVTEEILKKAGAIGEKEEDEK